MKGRMGLTPEALLAGRRTRDPSPLVMFPSCDREPMRAEVPLFQVSAPYFHGGR